MARGRKPGAQKTGGRQKGTPNKLSSDIREVIKAAFDEAGGKEYLVTLSKSDPRTFLTLVGKIVPTAITGGDEDDAPIKQVIEFTWGASKGSG